MPEDDDSQDAAFFRDRFSAVARARAEELEARARETGREIEAQARALMRRMQDAGIAAEQVDAPSLRDRITTSAKDVWDDLRSRWGQSVSIPRPVPVPEPPAAAPPVTVTAPSTVEYRVRTPDAADARRIEQSAAPAGVAAASSFPLSNDPVIEVVPTRTLRTGVVVPTYIEAPLYIKPPDHAYLTAHEAEEEEDIRLQLYSAIVARIEAAMVQLERQVVAHRRAKGITELRPLM